MPILIVLVKKPGTNAMESFRNLENKFRLHLSPAEACIKLKELIEENTGAGYFRDFRHEWANWFREVGLK